MCLNKYSIVGTEFNKSRELYWQIGDYCPFASIRWSFVPFNFPDFQCKMLRYRWSIPKNLIMEFGEAKLLCKVSRKGTWSFAEIRTSGFPIWKSLSFTAKFSTNIWVSPLPTELSTWSMKVMDSIITYWKCVQTCIYWIILYWNAHFQTPACDLRSELALKIKKNLLEVLADKTLYPDDPEKREEIYNRYKEYLKPVKLGKNVLPGVVIVGHFIDCVLYFSTPVKKSNGMVSVGKKRTTKSGKLLKRTISQNRGNMCYGRNCWMSCRKWKIRSLCRMKKNQKGNFWVGNCCVFQRMF